MKLPLQYITGEFYLILNAPEKPIKQEGEYNLPFEKKMRAYERALASAERLKVMNPEVLIEYHNIPDGTIIEYEGSYEVRTAGNCIEAGFFKCQDQNRNCQKETRCKNETDVAFLLPQEEQKPIKGIFAGDYPENMMTHALKAMVEEQKSELKPTDAGFKWFTCPTCDGKGSVPQDKSVEVIQQEKTAMRKDEIAEMLEVNRLLGERIRELEMMLFQARESRDEFKGLLMQGLAKISDLETELSKWKLEALQQARKVDSLTDENHSLDLKLETLREENDLMRETLKKAR